jgi:hypothetical protein
MRKTMRNLMTAAVTVVASALGWAAIADARLTYFKSPSGNIGCLIGSGSVRCDVRDNDWRAPRPAGCPAISDYGQGATVFHGKATIVCAGDTVLAPNASVLAYGRSKTVGPVTCTSRRSGMTCRRGRHGFFVSKARYRLF